MRQNLTVSLLAVCALFVACDNQPPKIDGKEFENRVLLTNNLSEDYSFKDMLISAIEDVNCAAPVLINKKIVLANKYSSSDTSQILIIPFSPNGESFKSSAYSDVKSHYILINTGYIKEFAIRNTLNDTTSFKPLLELMILHELGHFILQKTGSFDAISDSGNFKLGEQKSNSQPEYITSEKKIEMEADSLAVTMIRKNLAKNNKCFDINFNVELLIPTMQFQMSGRRMIDNFGVRDIHFLHDPSNSHPNMELRITFMNYFLYPNDSLKQLIDDYLYNRTVRPVQDQLIDPVIYQGLKKNLSGDSN